MVRCEDRGERWWNGGRVLGSLPRGRPLSALNVAVLGPSLLALDAT